MTPVHQEGDLGQVAHQKEAVKSGDLSLRTSDPQVTPGTLRSEEMSDLTSIETPDTHYSV